MLISRLKIVTKMLTVTKMSPSKLLNVGTTLENSTNVVVRPFDSVKSVKRVDSVESDCCPCDDCFLGISDVLSELTLCCSTAELCPGTTCTEISSKPRIKVKNIYL